jgi:hypothetical protein
MRKKQRDELRIFTRPVNSEETPFRLMKTIWLTILFFPIVLIAGELPADYKKQLSENEQKAIALYPDAGVENSKLWKAISDEIDRLDKTNPTFFDDPTYPVMLAAKVASTLGIAPSSPAAKKDISEQKLLAKPTPNEALTAALRQAAAQFPALREDGSYFSFLFLAAYKSKSREYLLAHPDYPLVLARKIESEIAEEKKAAVSPKPAPAVAAAAPKPEQTLEQQIAAAQAEVSNPTSADAYRAAKVLLREHGLVAQINPPDDGPTQRNGRPLPRTWIDPNQADANWNAQQLRNAIDANTRAIEDIRFKKFPR